MHPRSRTLGWGLALGVTVAACGPDTDTDGHRPSSDTPEATVSRTVDEKLDSLTDQMSRVELLAIEEKQAFMEALERRINRLEEQIETAGQKLNEVEESAEDTLAARQEQLKEQRVELVAKWRELSKAGAEEWSEMRTALVDAWAEAQAEVDKLLVDVREATTERTN